MEKGVDNFHSVPARLLSELCALQSCDRLCDDIITDFSREPAVLLQTSFPHHQPGLLGAYFQHGIGGIGHNFPVATHPAHSSALGQTLPYSASGRYGTPGNPLRVPGNLRQHQADGAGMTSVLNSSAHAGGGGVRRKRDSQLHSTINGQGIVPKRAAAQCMIYSCQNLSEPCKRKLKLCAEHKRAAQVRLHADGPVQRYCRYCHVLHDLDAFPQDDVRTICVRRNELRLQRSRERRQEIKLGQAPR